MKISSLKETILIIITLPFVLLILVSIVILLISYFLFFTVRLLSIETGVKETKEYMKYLSNYSN